MLTYKVTVFVVGWLTLCLLVGLYARNRRVGFIGGFLFSLILTPLVTAIFLLLFQSKPTPPEEEPPLE